MTPTELAELEKRHSWHPFTPMQAWAAEGHEPVMIESGSGCVLRDQHGHEYLDGNASIWTNIHGHNHPAINAAIIEQLGKVAHTSFLGFSHAPAALLAKELVDLLPGGKMERVFFSDDGSTAIECAVRMALQFWRQNGRPERDTILAFDRAYHGDTLGAASLGGISMFKGSANQFGYRVLRVASLDALDLLTIDDRSRLAAIIIEPLIQGVANMRLWPKGMLRELNAWCGQNDVFLILDEVMTGFGRTGKMFACLHEDVVPDFLCLAKGLTGGYLPLAATLTTKRVFEGFHGPENTFFYGHSYTANQLGCAAALASLRIFRDEAVLQHLEPKIALLAELLAEFQNVPGVLATRQLGLIAGIDVDASGAEVCLAARKHGLLTRPIQNTIVLMPPLCVSEAELRQMVSAVQRALAESRG